MASFTEVIDSVFICILRRVENPLVQSDSLKNRLSRLIDHPFFDLPQSLLSTLRFNRSAATKRIKKRPQTIDETLTDPKV